jgi:hypothetical protein
MKNFLQKNFSTFLVSFFFILCIFLALFAEVFQSRNSDIDLAALYATPIQWRQFNELREVKLSNKNGEFILENMNPLGLLEGPWQLTSPQALKVKSTVVEKMMNALRQIQIRQLFSLDAINLNSFSLDAPTATVSLSAISGRTLELKLGLINPIDNSSYMTFSGATQIYQIDPLSLSLESYDLAQMAESQILALNIESLQSFELVKENTSVLRWQKTADKWLGQTGNELNPEKIQKYFDKWENVKSSLVIEAGTPDQKLILERLLTNPQYLLRVQTFGGLRTYTITPYLESIPGVNLGVNQFYILSTDDKKSFSFVEKAQLNFLDKKIDI